MSQTPKEPDRNDEISSESDNEKEVSATSIIPTNLRPSPPEINRITWRYFKDEFFRLLTFVLYPPQATVSSIIFASMGFVFLGADSHFSFTRYFCNMVLERVKYVDDIDERHEGLSRNCRMVTGAGNCSSNIPMESRYSNNDRDVNSKFEASKKPKHLQSASVIDRREPNEEYESKPPGFGARKSKINDTIINTHSNQTNMLRDPQTNEDIFQEAFSRAVARVLPETSQERQTKTGFDAKSHMEPGNPKSKDTETPTHSHINENKTQQDRQVSNISDGKSRLSNVEQLGRPKPPEYKEYATRLASFDEWPRQHHVDTIDLAMAGFSYMGISDRVRCFCCGGIIHQWEQEDDVWVEHARHFPDCVFLRHNMGSKFIDTVQEMFEEQQRSLDNDDGGATSNKNQRQADTNSRSTTITYEDVLKRMRVMDASNGLLPSNRNLADHVLPSGRLVCEELFGDGHDKCPFCHVETKGTSNI